MSQGASFASMSARKASETPFEIELHLDGEPTGMFVSVLGQHCATVAKAINDAINDRRRKAAIAEARNAKARPDSADYEPVESDIAFGQRLAAVRLAGWRCVGETDGLSAEQKERFLGSTDPFTPEAGLIFCRENPDFASQVLDASNSTGNFMKVSSQT